MENEAGKYIERNLLSLHDIARKAHIGNERYLSDDDIDEAVNLALEQVGKSKAIQEVRDKYPTDIFPEGGKSIECKCAAMARLTCDNIEANLEKTINNLKI